MKHGIKGLILLALAVLLLALCAGASAEKLAAPDLEVPAELAAGEPLEFRSKKAFSPAEYLWWNLYRLNGEEEESLCGNTEILRYSSYATRVFSPYANEYSNGLEAGDYRIKAYYRADGYEESDTVTYDLTVTGSRPDVPEIIVATDEPYLSQEKEIRIAASHVDQLLFQREENGLWYSFSSRRQQDAGESVRVFFSWYSWYEQKSIRCRFRAKVGGAWSEWSDPFTLTWKDKGPADAPEVSLLQDTTVEAGVPLTVHWENMQQGETLRCEVYQKNPESEEFERFDGDQTSAEEDASAKDWKLEEYGFDPGDYRADFRIAKQDYQDSDPVSIQFTVTGERPANPQVQLSKETIELGESVTLTFRAEGLDSVQIGGDYNGKQYLAANDEVTVTMTPGWYGDGTWYYRALVNGRWTALYETPSVHVGETGNNRLSDIEPSLAETYPLGQDVSFAVKVDSRTEIFTVGIVQVDMSEDGEKDELREVEYERVLEIRNGQVTIPKECFSLPGVYELNFTAYAENCHCTSRGGLLISIVDSQVSSAEVTVTPGADPKSSADLPVTLFAQGASRFALRLEYESEEGYYTQMTEDSIPAANGTAEYTVDGWYLDQGYRYAISAMALVDGHWTGWSEGTIVDLRERGEMELSGFDILSGPEEVTSGVPFTVSWTPCEGAEYYMVQTRLDDCSLFETMRIPGTQTSAEITITKDPNQIQTFSYGSIWVWAAASGADAVGSDGCLEFILLSPNQLSVTPSAERVTPGGTVTFTLSGYKANDLRVRINGKDKGYLSFRADGEDGGTAALSFRETGAWQVQFSARWNPGIYEEGVWSNWSDPVTITVAEPELSTLILPADTVSVEAEAFRGTAAERVIINDGCTSIGNDAFLNCAHLIRVDIPASVTEIGTGGNNPFAGCAADLVIITPEGSTADTFAAAHGIQVKRP